MRSTVRARVLGVSLLALAAAPLFLGSVRTSGRIIVPEGEVVTEDLYGFGSLVIVEGVVEGDVFAVAGEVRVTGTIDGDLIGLVGGPVTVTGEITGAVRVAAVEVSATGSVGDDLAVLAIETVVGGEVGRDVLVVGGAVDLGGMIGRDVRLQALRLTVDAGVGRDVLARVDSMRLAGGADVGGDVLYRASREAEVDDGAVIAGQLTRRDVIAPVWARAVTRAVMIFSVLGVIVSGLVGLWLFPATAAAAVDRAERHPLRSGLIGAGFLVVVPLLAIPLFLTLAGIPVALFLLLSWLLAVVLGPIPAATAIGRRITGTPALSVAVVVGVLIWRGAMWLLPLVSGLLYVAVLSVGLGAFVESGWRLRLRNA
jgi:cytoskeletal protein CcmA (bactofilin family)